MRNVGALISVTSTREREVGPGRWRRCLSAAGQSSWRVCSQMSLAVLSGRSWGRVWCVVSGGRRLHQDTHRVAAEPWDSSYLVVIARFGLHKLSVAIPWQCGRQVRVPKLRVVPCARAKSRAAGCWLEPFGSAGREWRKGVLSIFFLWSGFNCK